MTNNTPVRAAHCSCTCHSEIEVLRKKLADYSSKTYAIRERNTWFAGTLCLFGGLLWWAAHTAYESGNLVTGATALIGLPAVSSCKEVRCEYKS
jgi:hypothetical protein